MLEGIVGLVHSYMVLNATENTGMELFDEK